MAIKPIFTKKQYEFIAQTIAEGTNNNHNGPKWLSRPNFIMLLTTKFAADNAKFDKRKFIASCNNSEHFIPPFSKKEKT